MSEITAKLVKELRERTGAGMMDCKSALVESSGDLEAAADWLRKKGLSAAAKKSGRVAAEGLIGIAVGGNAGAIAEVNSETDFVARNEQFQKFVRTVSELSLAHDGELDTVLATGYPGTDRTVAEELTHNIATIGENMAIRRTASISVENGCIAQYVHNSPAPGLGKIGVLVALESDAPAEKLERLGKDLAMHVAAKKDPTAQAVDVKDLDPELVEHERKILSEQARESGKPEEIIEKMIEGRLRKFYEEVVLLQQVSVIDQETRIADLLKAASEEIGAPVTIKGFLRFELGEGVEKKSDEDFAEEVKRVAGG